VVLSAGMTERGDATALRSSQPMGHMSEFDGPVTVSDSVTGVDPTQMNKAEAGSLFSHLQG
jgi:hypothetical protein